MPQPPRPEDVFTPKTIVTREMFEKRNEADVDGNPGLQDTFQDALRERGGQVLLYGDTGVGKSSLLKYAAEDEKLETVTVECLSSMGHADILEELVRSLIDVRKVSIRKDKSVGGEASVEGSVPFFAKIVGKVRTDASQSEDFELVEKSAIDVISSAMKKSGTSLIVLDNFQNITSLDTRILIAQTMEQLSDRAGRLDNAADIKCVVIGIAEDSRTLLGDSRSYGRRTTAVGVPRMPDDEIRGILSRGFELLELTLPDQLMNEFVFFSDGFPYFAHLLGLYVARAARRAGVSEIDRSMIDAALTRAASAVTTTHAERIRMAYEAGGEVQPRRQILAMLARSDAREWTSADVQSLWEAHLGARSEYSFMHTALSQLATPKYGNVLSRTGPRRRYLYRFEDPHMRPYLWITLQAQMAVSHTAEGGV